MILQQLLTLAVECILISVSSQSSPQQRRCAYHVTDKGDVYTTAGNVSGSVQLCKNTQCCVGYYVVIDGRPKADVLACDKVEKRCTDTTCKAQVFRNVRTFKCVCNTDLCNSNVTWSQNARDESQHASSYYKDETMTTALISIGILLALGLLIVAIQSRNFFTVKNKNSRSLDTYDFSLLRSHRKKEPSDIDATDVELQQVLCRGNFATVWLGTHQESRVAVKVFPASCKGKFAAEKEIYELPLMRHGGIVHFLGTARKPCGDSWLIVLQLAENDLSGPDCRRGFNKRGKEKQKEGCFLSVLEHQYIIESNRSAYLPLFCNGSLRTFLRENSVDWTSSLKLCLSLSQGLAYLHSDLHRHDAHKPPVAHGDLSSSNVLVRADGACVLCDFGCSAILHSFSGCHRQSDTTSPLNLVQWGTLRYMSPELLEGSVHLHNKWYLMHADVYSLALLLWEIWMCCSDFSHGGDAPPRHQLPYESELGANVSIESLILRVCHMGMRPYIPQHWEALSQGSALEEILTDSWDSEPDARLSAQCVADRLVSLQSYHNVPVKHLQASICVATA